MATTSKDKKADGSNQEDEAAKTFEGINEADMESIKRGIDEIRAYANSAMNECILLINAHTNYYYTTRDGKHRDKEQDKRIQDGARARGVAAIKNLRMYANRLEAEIRGIQKTL